MPSLDINFDYNKIQKKVNATKSFTDIKSQYDEANRKAGQSFEKTKSQVSESLTSVKNQTKRYQRQVSSQLEKLVDINKLLPDNRMSGKTTSSSVGLVKNQFTEALNTIIALIPEIITKEMMKQLGCSQEQTYDSSTASKGIYVPVSSVDLFGLLKVSPDTPLGKLSYETKDIQVQIR